MSDESKFILRRTATILYLKEKIRLAVQAASEMEPVDTSLPVLQIVEYARNARLTEAAKFSVLQNYAQLDRELIANLTSQLPPAAVDLECLNATASRAAIECDYA